MKAGIVGGGLDLVDALRTKMGDESQVAFSARLGIDQSMLSKVLARQTGVGPKVAGAILRQFPDLKEAVLAALTSPTRAA